MLGLDQVFNSCRKLKFLLCLIQYGLCGKCYANGFSERILPYVIQLLKKDDDISYSLSSYISLTSELLTYINMLDPQM